MPTPIKARPSNPIPFAAQPPAEPEEDKITPRVALADLEPMPLTAALLPPELRGYETSQAGPVSNEKFSQYPFRETTAADLQRLGRQGGWLQEHNSPRDWEIADGLLLTAATSVHLFDRPAAVASWIQEQFVEHALSRIGQKAGSAGRRLLQAQQLPEPAGLYDRAAALYLLQDSPMGIFTVNMVNFRLGRLLGSAFIGTIGDHSRPEITQTLAQALERNMAQVLFH